MGALIQSWCSTSSTHFTHLGKVNAPCSEEQGHGLLFFYHYHRLLCIVIHYLPIMNCFNYTVLLMLRMEPLWRFQLKKVFMFSQYFCKHWDQVEAYKYKIGVKILWKRITDIAMNQQDQPRRYWKHISSQLYLEDRSGSVFDRTLGLSLEEQGLIFVTLHVSGQRSMEKCCIKGLLQQSGQKCPDGEGIRSLEMKQ